MAKKLVVASHNHGKLLELKKLLGADFELSLLGQYTTQSVVEDGLSFMENAILKARFASKISGLPAIADDSGLMVDYLAGKPGIYSARFAEDEQGFYDHKDATNNAKLLRLLHNIPQQQRKAQFVCVLAVVNHGDDQLPLVCQGIWAGEILTAPIGANGFGYDPLFWVKEYQLSSAELSPNLKNKISHRAKAFNELQRFLPAKLQP